MERNSQNARCYSFCGDDALNGWAWNQWYKPDNGTLFNQNLYVQQFQEWPLTDADGPSIPVDDIDIAQWQVSNIFLIDPNIRLSKTQFTGTLSVDNAVLVHWDEEGSKKESPSQTGNLGRADILAFVIPARGYALGSAMNPGDEFTGLVDLGGDKDDPTNIVTPLGDGGYEHAAAFLSYNMERYYIWWNFFDRTIRKEKSNRNQYGEWKGLK